MARKGRAFVPENDKTQMFVEAEKMKPIARTTADSVKKRGRQTRRPSVHLHGRYLFSIRHKTPFPHRRRLHPLPSSYLLLLHPLTQTNWIPWSLSCSLRRIYRAFCSMQGGNHPTPSSFPPSQERHKNAPQLMRCISDLKTCSNRNSFVLRWDDFLSNVSFREDMTRPRS